MMLHADSSGRSNRLRAGHAWRPRPVHARFSIVVLLLVALWEVSAYGQAGPSSPQEGSAEAGRALWQEPRIACRNCHGVRGEGGFGPDLAGRGLTVSQFIVAVRNPWGVMPSFTEAQLSDSNMRDLVAYFATLPRVSEPARWRTLVPAGAPLGQELLVATGGCGQCHGPVAAMMRMVAGGEGGDYAWFARRVYEHTSTMPPHEPDPRMGNYSRTRFPEALLQELWRYLSGDLKLRAFVRAEIGRGVVSDGGLTYTLTVQNRGTPGSGLTAEELSILLRLPPGAKVETASGSGYQGTRHDQESGAEMAVWHLERLAPADRQTYSITLSGSVPAGTALTGSVRWMRPPVGGASPDTVSAVAAPAQSQ